MVFSDIIDAKIVKCLVERITRELINPVTGEVFKLEDIKIDEIKESTRVALVQAGYEFPQPATVIEDTSTKVEEPEVPMSDLSSSTSVEESKVEEPTKEEPIEEEPEVEEPRVEEPTIPVITVDEPTEEPTTDNSTPYQDSDHLSVSPESK